jgi:plastocyanin
MVIAFLGLCILASNAPRLQARPRQQSGSRTGTIRGRVELRPSLTAPVQRPNVADLGAPERHESAERAQAVVYLDSAPRGAFEQPMPGRATMDQRNETFVPHVLAVTTGTVVSFPNSDHIYHNVFSLSKPTRFDLGRYAAGRSKSVRFDRPGIVRVFCDIHSHMSAFILVFTHPFFAVTDDEGRYRIEGVPPGTYPLVAWSDRGSFETRTIVVTEGGTSQADFSPR